MIASKNMFQGLSPELLRKRKKSSFPSFIKPMLATLTEDYFSDPEWLYEHKFDGIRCLAFKKKGTVTIKSRNNRIINDEYPEVVAALQKQAADNFVIDGEIISPNKKGISDFELLQGRMHVIQNKKNNNKIKIIFYVFDLMHVHGYDIRALPLLARKQLLKKLLRYTQTLKYTDHIIGKGIPLFKKACSQHWEGVIAKYSQSHYAEKRSSDWLKFKCIMKQELVIGGYTQPQGSRSHFGALLVGFYAHGTLRYAGKVGTGYNQDTLENLGKKLRRLTIKTCPFTDYDETTLRVHWVKPQLVAEFEFAQWTKANKLRVGRYKGLREDKAAKDVVKEVPKIIGPH